MHRWSRCLAAQSWSRRLAVRHITIRPAATPRARASEAMALTDAEKFYFDLNGFIIVRGVLTAEEVSAANAAVDAHAAEIKERVDPALRNTRTGTPLSGDGKSGRQDLCGMLAWPRPHCDPFRSFLAHPKLIPYLSAFCGDGYRMDHLPFVILQRRGSEGFSLHGGPLTGDGRFNPTLQYRFEQGQFYNSLLGMSVQLSDHNAGDGGFCVVRGSHKINCPLPDAFRHGSEAQEHLYQPTTKAGDVVFFSEATVHGALPWAADHERRIALYRFAPATVAYGRSYTPSWPEGMLDGLTDQQRAVLEPPYAERLDRPIVKHDKDSTVITGRAEKKRKFDQEVFGTAYF